MTKSLPLRSQLLQSLRNGLAVLHQTLDPHIEEKLIDYVELLHEWNAVYNLTGIRDPMVMVERHLLDSLSLMPILTGKRILDVGTGAGLPGIPLALARPDLFFVLLDSNQKKMNFVQHVILSLKIENAITCVERVEKYYPSELFDWVISRAFASLSDFLLMTSHLTVQDGKWLAMKGPISSIQFPEHPEGYTIIKIEKYQGPGVDRGHSLVIVGKTT